jgi:hypothetical protein
LIFEAQEKASNVLEQENQVIAAHLAYLKESAALLAKEGEILNKAQSVEGGDDDGDAEMDLYINSVEQIISRKLQIY